MRLLTLTLAFACALGLGLATHQEAGADRAVRQGQEAGPSRARLVAAGHVAPELVAGRSHLPTPLMLAGIKITLDKGWKTYWRTPGDGIAPRFDWTGSENVAAAQVLWPVPRHFRDIAGEYNGYKDQVIFPVLIAPRSTREPVRLRLSLDYAVCEEICVPVSTALSRDMREGAGKERKAVLAALARTPVRAGPHGGCENDLTFSQIGAQWGADAAEIDVVIAHSSHARPRDLFAEAATGMFLPHPQQQAKTREHETSYRLSLHGMENPRAAIGDTVTFTVVGPEHSCELTWSVK